MRKRVTTMSTGTACTMPRRAKCSISSRRPRQDLPAKSTRRATGFFRRRRHPASLLSPLARFMRSPPAKNYVIRKKRPHSPLSASTTTLFLDLDHTIMRNTFASSVLPVFYEEIHRETGVPTADVRVLVVREHNRRLNSACAPYPRVMDWDDIVREVACSLGCAPK